MGVGFGGVWFVWWCGGYGGGGGFFFFFFFFFCYLQFLLDCARVWILLFFVLNEASGCSIEW